MFGLKKTLTIIQKQNIALGGLLHKSYYELDTVYTFADSMARCKSWNEFLNISKHYLDWRYPNV